MASMSLVSPLPKVLHPFINKREKIYGNLKPIHLNTKSL